MNKTSRSTDRISGLPDPVLSHILSYVTTKESVRTSILSKRWLSVWSYVPVLDLDDSLLSVSNPKKYHAIHSSFIQFLNNVFDLHKADYLQKFTLKCSKFDCYRVSEWILAAMKNRVTELDLCISSITMDNVHFKLPLPLFVYRSLVALKLGKNLALDTPGEVLLPCLEKLYLDAITFLNDESCPRLLSGCPVLENFYMDNCCTRYVQTLWITVPTLKILVIECQRFFYGRENLEYKVVVDAPKLEVLRYKCSMAKGGYSFKNLDSLIEAYIDVDLEQWDKKNNNIMRIAYQLVKGIAHAKFITFTRNSTKVLCFQDMFFLLPMFNELTKLVLGVMAICYLIFLRMLRLYKVLVLREERTKFPFSLIWHDPVEVPWCLLNSLKTVEFWGFTRNSELQKFLTYLVSNGKFLSGFSRKGDHVVSNTC